MPKATRRADAAVTPDEIGEPITSYRPRGIELDSWSAVQPFVLDCAERIPLSGWASTVRILGTLARLAAWAQGEGLSLDLETILDPDTVERFVELGLSDDHSRATYRSVLRRIGPLLTVRAPWEPRPASVARRQVAAPYLPFEVEQLRIDALKQPTEARRRSSRAFLALGLGAGLDGRWVTRVRGCDVSPRGDVVVVTVGEPSARTVPVLRMWEDDVLELAATADDAFLVGGHSTAKNRASSLAASLVVPPGTTLTACEVFVPSRHRTTSCRSGGPSVDKEPGMTSRSAPSPVVSEHATGPPD